MAVTVLIPSLNPDEKLTGVVEGLLAAGMKDILLVDDGSDQAHQTPFAQLGRLPGVTVLHHPVNRGKGQALKTGFAYIVENRPASAGVVTVDGDGQHSVRDICRVAEAMEREPAVWLGCRNFDDPSVPRRSRLGNKASCITMRLLCRLRISDTQTGLRGIPTAFLPTFLEVKGERFEYETNMLLALRERCIPFRELTIETIYIDDNATSHFRPLRDGWRVYRLMLGFFLRYMGVGLLSFVTDILLFSLLLYLLAFGRMEEHLHILTATVVARVLSSLLNFALNYRVVFHSSIRLKSTVWRYYLVCVCQMLVSAAAVSGLSVLMPIVSATLIKCMVDTCLFVISFQVQQRLVFNGK